MLLEKIRQKAKKAKARIIFPESEDPRILNACKILAEKGIAYPVLIGKNKEILKGLNKESISIVDHLSSPDNKAYAQKLYELRKHKGISYEDAKQLLRQKVYFGMMMLKHGKADALIYGASHPTSETLRPAFQIIKTQKGIKKVSGAFLMEKQDRVFLFADCAVIADPNEQELAETALLSAKSYESLTGNKAKIAMLSYSTNSSSRGPSSEKVRKAVKIAKKMGLNAEGEIQADAALLKEVCEKKFPGSRIMGDANVLIFPCLDAGNIGYKLVERLAKYKAIGPILQGLAMQVNDLSRGCSVDDIVDLAAITAVQSRGIKGGKNNNTCD